MKWVIVISIAVTVLLVLLAMNFVRPDKKVERKVEHRYGIHDEQFQREMSVLLGPAIVDGNRVTALQNGSEIFPSMLAAIRGAKVSISFETYIYWSGVIGQEFSDALAERAEAGVPVNVTIDWLGSVKMDQNLLDRMEAAGVILHRYRPLHWYNLSRMNNRTHRKLLVVDGKIGFTGGVGVADHWTGGATDPEHWRDSHFRIEGPVVAQFQAAFNDNWIKQTGDVVNGASYFPFIAPVPGGVRSQMFLASPAGGSESMHLMYLMAIAASKQTIDLAASYFVPDKLALDALVDARKRGVRIRIVLPGEHIDSEAVRLRSRALWGDLLEAGVEIQEYSPTMMHTKMLIIDGLMVSVGSTNFDIRSFQLNDEASLNIYDESFAREMTEVFEADLAQSKPYTFEMWKNRPWYTRLAEGLLYPITSQL